MRFSSTLHLNYCTGTNSTPRSTWDFSGLKVTGGKAGAVKNAVVSGEDVFQIATHKKHLAKFGSQAEATENSFSYIRIWELVQLVNVWRKGY